MGSFFLFYAFRLLYGENSLLLQLLQTSYRTLLNFYEFLLTPSEIWTILRDRESGFRLVNLHASNWKWLDLEVA